MNAPVLVCVCVRVRAFVAVCPNLQHIDLQSFGGRVSDRGPSWRCDSLRLWSWSRAAQIYRTLTFKVSGASSSDDRPSRHCASGCTSFADTSTLGGCKQVSRRGPFGSLSFRAARAFAAHQPWRLLAKPRTKPKKTKKQPCRGGVL